MSRQRRRIPELTTIDREELFDLECDVRHEDRVKAILMIDEGFSVTEVAEKLGCGKSSIHRWLDSFEKNGVAGLRDGRRSGLRKKVTHPEKEVICKKVRNGVSEEQVAQNSSISRKMLMDIVREFDISHRSPQEILEEQRGVLFRPTAMRFEAVLLLKEYFVFVTSLTHSADGLNEVRNLGLRHEKGPLNRALIAYLREWEPVYPIDGDGSKELQDQMRRIYRRCTHSDIEVHLLSTGSIPDSEILKWFASKRNAQLFEYSDWESWETELRRWLIRLAEPESVDEYWDTEEQMADYLIDKIAEFVEVEKGGFVW